MPRVFAPEQAHNFNQGAIEFTNGVAELPSTVSARITAALTADGYTVDTSKNERTVIDLLTLAQIKEICDYLGISYLAGDTKYQVIRKLETGISTLKLGALTVASTDGGVLTKTDIAITEALGEGNQLYYKLHATTAPTLLYGDTVDSTWTAFASGDDIVATTGHKIGVVEAVLATGFVVKYGSDTVDAKDA